MKKRIIVQPLGGLGNRMRAIVGAYDLSKKMNRELVVVWTRDITLNEKFSNIFEEIPCRVIECQLNTLFYKFLYRLLKYVLRYRIIDDSFVVRNCKSQSITWTKPMVNDNLFIVSCENITLSEDFSILKLNKMLKEKIPFRIDRDKTIGIHIRRVDNEKSIKYSPSTLFFDKIDEKLRLEPSTRFYLATDDSDEEKAFINKYGDSIIVYHKSSLDRNNPMAIHDAAIDLYLLSCCKEIYGSYYSSFSDTAALWGGIVKDVLKITL